MPNTGQRRLRVTDKGVNVRVKVSPDLHLKLVSLASDERRSLAQQVIVLLEKGVSDHESRGIGEKTMSSLVVSS